MHRNKSNCNGLWASYGQAPFERARCFLDIRGDRLEPAEVTALLGIKPTKSYKKGDQTLSGRQLRRTGLWQLQKLLVHHKTRQSRQFEKWLASLPKSRSVWNDLHKRFAVRIELVVDNNSANGEFFLTPGVAEELARRRLGLLVDAYFHLDER